MANGTPLEIGETFDWGFHRPNRYRIVATDHGPGIEEIKKDHWNAPQAVVALGWIFEIEGECYRFELGKFGDVGIYRLNPERGTLGLAVQEP